MAYIAEWSIPALESKGFPKKEGLFSFAANTGATRKSFQVQKEWSNTSHLLMNAIATNQPIPLIDVFFERQELGTTVTYMKYSFRECLIAEIRHSTAAGTSAAAGNKANRNDTTEVEAVKITFASMIEMPGKHVATADSWKL
jgi:type VI protein secretion system component Hcp